MSLNGTLVYSAWTAAAFRDNTHHTEWQIAIEDHHYVAQTENKRWNRRASSLSVVRCIHFLWLPLVYWLLHWVFNALHLYSVILRLMFTLGFCLVFSSVLFGNYPFSHSLFFSQHHQDLWGDKDCENWNGKESRDKSCLFTLYPAESSVCIGIIPLCMSRKLLKGKKIETNVKIIKINKFSMSLLYQNLSSHKLINFFVRYLISRCSFACQSATWVYLNLSDRTTNMLMIEHFGLCSVKEQISTFFSLG